MRLADLTAVDVAKVKVVVPAAGGRRGGGRTNEAWEDQKVGFF